MTLPWPPLLASFVSEPCSLCPEETPAAIDPAALEQFLLADVPVVEACLAGITDDELRPFFETREFSELINAIREDCLF